ncbi:archaeosortase A [Halorarius litoreus]|uniref:archaeosortase A n=1 Tax=Halorarius litoreus TaxID=2962676 RepID=UPI0020CEED11|nr:archaeosortase A [Halorarius litoreus]
MQQLDALAWLVVVTFLVGALVEPRASHAGRWLSTAAWLLFAAFWALLVPHFALVQLSYVEGILSALAVPACGYAGYLTLRGRESLLVLARAVGVMGLVYLPATTLAVVRVPLVELVTRQVEWSIAAVGYTPEVVTEAGVRNVFVFRSGERIDRSVEILLACTGLGSMAIFAGLVTAVRAPLASKLRALAVTLPVIWVLNVARNVFITLAYGHQWLQVRPALVLWLFGADHPDLVSFLLADRVIAQTLSVVVVVGLLLAVSRELPELRLVIGDLLEVTTGSDYQFGTLDESVRADGGRREDD